MKSSLKRPRQELLNKLGMELGREISAETVFFHEAVAQKLGLNATDTRCLELISRAGTSELTAGDLGRATGLTTGAVTGIIDRLESAGLVERVRDLSDRRRLFVRPRLDATRHLEKLYEALGAAMMELASTYQTKDLELISGFLERSLLILREQITKLS